MTNGELWKECHAVTHTRVANRAQVYMISPWPSWRVLRDRTYDLEVNCSVLSTGQCVSVSVCVFMLTVCV